MKIGATDRRGAILRRQALVRASSNECGHHGLVALLSRDVQRRGVAMHCRVLVRASSTEREYHGHVAILNRDHQ